MSLLKTRISDSASPAAELNHTQRSSGEGGAVGVGSLPCGTKIHLSWSHQLRLQQLAFGRLAHGPNLPCHLFLYEVVLEHRLPPIHLGTAPACFLPPGLA